MAGATPNETISAKLSKSLPILELTLRIRAIIPSKKSGMVARKINAAAHKSSPFDANRMAKTPKSKLHRVMKFGMCFLIVTGKRLAN